MKAHQKRMDKQCCQSRKQGFGLKVNNCSPIGFMRAPFGPLSRLFQAVLLEAAGSAKAPMGVAGPGAWGG
jgi:hypothetical protein